MDRYQIRRPIPVDPSRPETWPRPEWRRRAELARERYGYVAVSARQTVSVAL